MNINLCDKVRVFIVLQFQRCVVTAAGVVHTIATVVTDHIITSMVITTGEDAAASVIATDDTAAKYM